MELGRWDRNRNLFRWWVGGESKTFPGQQLKCRITSTVLHFPSQAKDFLKTVVPSQTHEQSDGSKHCYFSVCPTKVPSSFELGRDMTRTVLGTTHTRDTVFIASTESLTTLQESKGIADSPAHGQVSLLSLTSSFSLLPPIA